MKYRTALAFAALLVWLAFNVEVSAQVVLPPLFSDNMVLQQKTEAPIWGKAAPGAEIKVTVSWHRRSYETVTSDDGTWQVEVSTPKAGGPYSLTILENGRSPLTLSNVLVGEVWLCSGQSNMEMPVGGSWGKVLNYEHEIAEAARYPEIRLMSVDLLSSPLPKDDFSAVNDGWMVCSPESVDTFSATAYFFGKEIHLKENVPVGLINASWGGTVIEAWMSREALEGVKDLEDQAEMVFGWPCDPEVRRTEYMKELDDWVRRNAGYDREHIGREDFAQICFDDSRWDILAFPGYIESLYPDLDGHVLARRTVSLPSFWAGHPVVLHMDAVDDNDITYFNGVRVGETYGWNLERNYTIPAEAVAEGEAVIAIRIMDTKGTGGIAGGFDSFFLEGPDGSRVSLSGEWCVTKDLDYNGFSHKPVNKYDDPNWPTLLFNAMINPLIPYSIKGAIWYQGCSNEERAYQYRDLMRLMIRDWRSRWGYDFPFYITQLANFRPLQTVPCNSMWAELREAQDMAARTVAGTGMAVTIDIGDANDVHPKNKQEVGRRLALQALNKAYGRNVVCSGPVYEGYEIDGNIIRIRFSSVAEGLVHNGDRLVGFAVAGADRQFHWAEAEIVGSCVEVSCEDVPRPLAVRYAWADNPLGNLYNTEGLPAVPFRTDDWKGLTVGRTSRH